MLTAIIGRISIGEHRGSFGSVPAFRSALRLNIVSTAAIAVAAAARSFRDALTTTNAYKSILRAGAGDVAGTSASPTAGVPSGG